MSALVDTEEDFDWLDDDDGSKLRAALKDLHDQGFRECPGDMPVGEPGREYAYYGPLAFYREQS